MVLLIKVSSLYLLSFTHIYPSDQGGAGGCNSEILHKCTKSQGRWGGSRLALKPTHPWRVQAGGCPGLRERISELSTPLSSRWCPSHCLRWTVDERKERMDKLVACRFTVVLRLAAHQSHLGSLQSIGPKHQYVFPMCNQI